MTYRNWAAGAVGAVAILLTSAAAHADGIHVLDPIDGAVVREVVKIRVAKTDLPANGYVAVSIDGQLRSARLLPDTGDVVYLWDTKAPILTGNVDLTTPPTYVADGDHVITISVYAPGTDPTQADKKLIGTQSINVKLANKITTVPPNGVSLKYKFRLNDTYHYSRNSELDVTTGTENPSVTKAKFLFDRTIEDVAGGESLLRDRVIPRGFIQKDGSTQKLTEAYNLKSKFRTFTTEGRQIDEMKPLTPGTHLGFSIPALPERKVAIGDSWQAPVQVSLKWTGNDPAKFTAEAHLEDFEWQDKYPCARIRETYSGPMTFPVSKDEPAAASASPYGASSSGYGGSSSGMGGQASAMAAMYSRMSRGGSGGGSSAPVAGAATPTGPVTEVTLPDVKFERIVYVAYGSGRLIKTQTTLSVASIQQQDLTNLALDSGLPTPAYSYGSSSASYGSPSSYAPTGGGSGGSSAAMAQMYQKYAQASQGGSSSGGSGGSSSEQMSKMYAQMYGGGSDPYSADSGGDNGTPTPEPSTEIGTGVQAPDATVKLAFSEDTEILGAKAY